MSRPKVILAPHWRQMDELFAASDLDRLHQIADVVWGKDDPIPAEVLSDHWPDAAAFITTTPQVDAALLVAAPALRAVIEVSGAFPDTIDYAACAARGVEVLSCAPGFRQSVAEMAVAMALAGARGLVTEHEAFRTGRENWLDDCAGRDFTLYGTDIGFVGYGQIARETHRLLAPFSPRVRVYDPWLADDAAIAAGVTKVDLQTVLEYSQCLFVAAAPTHENRGMLNRAAFDRMPQGAQLILISRAHLVDFDDLCSAVASGRIRAAVDVFPSEPVAPDASLRQLDGLILSPHRAAAVPGGRQLIGKLIVDDLTAIFAGQDPTGLQRAATVDTTQLAGVGDATQVADMAAKRN